ncbi:MAG: LPS export ABC transporter periplasmic protein LptC [Candidatus Omnitrophota bacterium]
MFNKNLAFSFIFILSLFLLWGVNPVLAQEEDNPEQSQQKIKDFYLSNFKEDGTKEWEVKGEEAIVYDEYVDIDQMDANYYAENDVLAVTSDKAKLNKENMDVNLKGNVHVENADGMKLDTETLDWQREKNHIETDDKVKTSQDNMQITATGLSADTALKEADFKKDVEVVFPEGETGEVSTATCTGALEIAYALGTAIFNDNVVVTHTQGKLFSDKTTLYFDTEGKQIEKIVSEGNVKIVKDGNDTFSEKATYYALEKRIVLEGRPRIVYHPKEGDSLNFP